MFGRYSIDSKGLNYAGGEFDYNRYHAFKPDKDNVLPILQGAYFEDDIVSRFIKFLEVTFGEETLVENLNLLLRRLLERKKEKQLRKL